eukprot:TRINITY_DN13627_c0_g1_i1.p1 TRINITY_DN13627_c0_g1~~TRINITY_DN13627_c0_g1_i1.p1  ORF type:complete len:982 (+),score=261.70 TRINITY_DN13627_c0_g1_i1:55-3000(+)
MGSKIVRERHLATCGSTRAQLEKPPTWSGKGDYSTPSLKRVRCAENEHLKIPRGTVATILSAKFIRGGRVTDVTDRVRECLNRGGLEIRATVALCGGSPDPGRRRVRGGLVIDYTPTGRAPVTVEGSRRGVLDGQYNPVGEAGGATLYQRHDGACLFRVRQGEWEGRWALSRNAEVYPEVVSPFAGEDLAAETACLLELRVDKSREAWASDDGSALWETGDRSGAPDVVIGDSDVAMGPGAPPSARSSDAPSVAEGTAVVRRSEAEPTIISVLGSSAAATQGVQRGMRLCRVAQTDVTNLRAAEGALRAAPARFSVLVEVHWLEPREGGMRRRRIHITPEASTEADLEWEERRQRGMREDSVKQTELVQRLTSTQRHLHEQVTGRHDTTVAVKEHKVVQQMDSVFPPRMTVPDMRRKLGTVPPEPSGDMATRWLQMIRDGSPEQSIIWLYCSVDLRDTSKTKNADERLQKSGARCRRVLDKMFAARGHAPMVREWHSAADVTRAPTSRRDVRQLIRSGERYGVLMDILATRRYIWSGEPHKVAADVYAYLDEHYAVLVKFVLVGITDNASKRVARDMFCLDRLPPEQGGPERFVTSALNKTTDRRKFKHAAPPPMDGIDNEHQYVVFPHSDWERCEIVKRGEKWRRDKEQQRHDRYFTPKWNSEQGGAEPPPHWLLALEEKRAEQEERLVQAADAARRARIEEVRRRQAATPDPDAAVPAFMRSTVSSERQRTVPPAQLSPRHMLVEQPPLLQTRSSPLAVPFAQEDTHENCPRCWTHAVPPRAHGLMVSVVSPAADAPTRDDGDATGGGAQTTAEVLAAVAKVSGAVPAAAGALGSSGLFVSLPDDSSTPPPEAFATGKLEKSKRGLSPRQHRRGSRRQSRSVSRDELAESASGQAATALQKLDAAERKLRKLSRHYNQALRERRHEQVLKERAESAVHDVWHRRTLDKVTAVSGAAFVSEAPARIPSPNKHPARAAAKK